MGDTAVRLARPEEYEAVGALSVEAYAADDLIPSGFSYADELRDAAGRAAEAELLVAVDADDRLLGTVTFCLGGTAYAEIAGEGEAAFRMLAVASSARGRGVGEALVRACLDRARAAGCAAVRLSTKPEMLAAHRIYEQLGFRRIPALDWSPVSGVTLLAYTLDL